MSAGEGESLSPYITNNGWAVVPPQIAHWLESRAKVTPDIRERLRDTDWDACQVLTALHRVALTYSRSDIGTKVVGRHSDQQQSEVWMSTVEAAAALGVTDRAVRKWCHSERLPARMSGCRWVIRKTDVDTFKLTSE